jgi:hypothetical protein
VTEHVGKTGLVGVLKNGPGPVVMVRTEMDALPMEEKTGLALGQQGAANGRFGQDDLCRCTPAGMTFIWRGGWARRRLWWR